MQPEYIGDDASFKHGSIVSIASVKYFDLYFSYDKNDYARILSNVDKFIEEVNNVGENRISCVTQKNILNIF